jgi:hypothetical protein
MTIPKPYTSSPTPLASYDIFKLLLMALCYMQCSCIEDYMFSKGSLHCTS